MSISLSPKQQRYVDQLIESGQFQSTAEVIDRALDALQLQQALELDNGAAHEDLSALKAEIAHAMQQFQRGEGIELDRVALMRELRQRVGRQA